ncbi:MAG TPA: TIGR02147 family protein [Polyangiaceae bacterium]|nr:TIGR02147 family protein [Polyangiaceae bacterium]
MPAKPRKRLRCPIDVFRYHDYRAFLAAYYEHKKPQGFSYRAFASAAGLGAPNYLQLVIQGRRNLTGDMARRFAETCGLGADAAGFFVTLVAFNQASNNQERNQHYEKLSGFRRYRRAQKLELSEAAYHSRGYLPAIRELASSASFREDPAWIAERLTPPIKASEARQALDTLLELHLLERGPDGRLRQGTRVVSTGPETQGMHITNYHAEMMQRATAAMTLVPARERDISSLTLCLGSDGIARLKERIQAFRRELLELAESDSQPSQVVQVNFQLFPLSKDTAQDAPPPTPPASKDSA